MVAFSNEYYFILWLFFPIRFVIGFFYFFYFFFKNFFLFFLFFLFCYDGVYIDIYVYILMSCFSIHIYNGLLLVGIYVLVSMSCISVRWFMTDVLLGQINKDRLFYLLSLLNSLDNYGVLLLV